MAIGLDPTSIGISAADARQPGELAPAEIMLGLGDAGPSMVGGAAMTEMDDGGVTIDFGGAMPAMSAPPTWDANLADWMPEDDLARIGGELSDAVDQDKASSSQWEATYLRGVKSLGVTSENRDGVFNGACGARDPLFAEAVIRFQATYRGELLPAGGPVKTMIAGAETPELRDQAERVKAFMNYYLTSVDRTYYSDSDQMGFWLAIAGSTFKKVYPNPRTGLPIARFIPPDRFIVAYTTTHINDAPRRTHEFLISKRDYIWGKLTGLYGNADLGIADTMPEQSATQQAIDGAQGTTPTAIVGDEEYTFRETHVDYDLPGFEHRDGMGQPTGLGLPYIITLEKQSRKIVSIRRNWREDDPTYKARQYFVGYKFLPGLGVYGFGLAHVLGGYEEAATSLLRQLVDAGEFANFPGGFRQKGIRLPDGDNNVTVGPGQWIEIDVPGNDIRQAFMPFPAKEPSVVLKDLRNEMVESARRIASTAEIAVGDGRQDAPVGTTVALLEAATKIESAVIKRCYAAQMEEFALLAEWFGETLPEEGYPFQMPGGETAVMRQDFDNRIDIIPVGDPNIPSSSQRMLRAEAVFRTAGALPDIHNMREAASYLYETWGIPRQQIERILPQPSQAQPMDPVSENQVALRGGPLAVGPWQDDDAHIAVHMSMAESAPSLAAHVAEHFGNKFRKAVEQAIGIPLPPLGQGMPPEVENEIARMVAQSIEAIKQATGTTPGGQDMLAVAMEDIKVKAKDVANKHEAALAKIRQAAFAEWVRHLDKQGDAQTRLRIAGMQAEVRKEVARQKPATSQSARR